MDKQWVDSIAKVLGIKKKDSSMVITGPALEVRWKEWLDPKFCCRTCPEGSFKTRPYTPRLTARDDDDIIENGGLRF